MKKQIIIVILFLFIGLIACGKKSTPEKSNPDTTTAVKDTLSEPQQPIKENDGPPTKTVLRWSDCTITLGGYFMLNEDTGTIYETDTLIIYAELGTYTDSFSIFVSNEKLTDIKIEEQYETSITINNEGPHCDMIDWRHYTSPWRSIKKETNGSFTTEAYSEKERAQFSKVKKGDIKEAVKKHCKEDRWIELIKDNQLPNEGNCVVTISRLFFKISAKNKETGNMVNRIIIVEVPMGC